MCDVSIPLDRRLGEFTTPYFRFQYDSRKHILVSSVWAKDATAFFRELKTEVHRAKSKEALVFIHGFNSSFEDAVRRTAQLTYDLKFKGAPISFSWPSHHITDLQTLALLTPFDAVQRIALRGSYNGAIENAELAAQPLKEFLDEVSRRTGATTIHLIAHSMGARLVARALNSLSGSATYSSRTRFRQLVLAAPDIDV